ncbi:MAG: AMP-binding protein [Planctomycetaceae bacterium]|nr:AMP-binding protein [Planctomycetaceae bacterium]
MNICEHLSTTAGVVPDAVALQFESDVWSYGHLEELSRRSAQVLHEAGVRPGDRVALMLANVPAFPVWYYAALRLGAIAVSVSTRSAATEVAFVIDDSGARVLVSDQATQQMVTGELTDRVQTIVASDCGRQVAGRSLDGQAFDGWYDAAPDDPALILYTSGTTGFPKGATLSHGNVRSNVCAFNHLCDMRPTDRVLLSVPLFHCFGQNALLNSVLNVGGTLVLQRRFDLNEARRLIAAHGVTQLYGVPMMFQLFADSCEAAELQGVRYCFSAAAPLPIQTSERWQEKFGQPIYEGYGLTETSPFASYNHRYAFVPGSIGVPIDNVEMKIVDTQTGADCPAGELGEIAVRGPNVMLGYWGRPEETQAAIRDGWFFSGDIGRQDERGYFSIVDRVKDMIAVGGLKVYPAEVERVLRDHRAVGQVAVVGIPDAVFGEQVVAFVVPEQADLTEDDLRDIQQYARQNLANYKVPRVVVKLEELPRNPSGKVLKTQLRTYSLEDAVRLESEGQADVAAQSQLREPTLRKTLLATHAATRQAACIDFVQHLVQHVADTESLLDPDTRLLDAGLDSLMLVEISNQIQVEVGPDVTVAATLVFDQPRISDLGEYLLATILPEDSAAENRSSGGPQNASGDRRVADTETLQRQVAELSEEEALAELMKELSDS